MHYTHNIHCYICITDNTIALSNLYWCFHKSDYLKSSEDAVRFSINKKLVLILENVDFFFTICTSISQIERFLNNWEK